MGTLHKRIGQVLSSDLAGRADKRHRGGQAALWNGWTDTGVEQWCLAELPGLVARGCRTQMQTASVTDAVAETDRMELGLCVEHGADCDHCQMLNGRCLTIRCLRGWLAVMLWAHRVWHQPGDDGLSE